MIGVTVATTAHAGRGDELAAAWVHAAKLTLARDPGCRSFRVLRSTEDPDRVVAVELYDTLEALAAHNASDLSRELLPTLMPLVAGPPDVQVARMIFDENSDDGART